MSREILELLNTSTAKEQSIVEKFRSRGRAQVQEFCDFGTKEECVRSGDTPQPCTKLHFRSASAPPSLHPIPHSPPSLHFYPNPTYLN